MAEEERPHLPVGTKVKSYKIVDFIGAGGYGDIYSVQDISSGKLFAMKIEYKDAEKQGLQDEIDFMKTIQGTPLLPVLVTHGSHSNYRYLIMELLGPSVSNMRRSLSPHHYTPFSVNALAFHMLTCIEQLHSYGITHRDIKPGNFLLRPSRIHPVCLIDFGLSKLYLNPETKQHIPFSENAGFTGTCRYASLHAHDSYELSRRDDLFSWFYSIIELAEGRVPWPGSKDRELTAHLKKTLTVSELCRSLSPQYSEIYQIIQSLKFNQTPNYDKIKSLISESIIAIPKQHLYDWETPEYRDHADLKKISSISLETSEPLSLNDEPFDLDKIPTSEGGCAHCDIM